MTYVDMIHITCGTRVDVTSRPKMHPTNYCPTEHNAYAKTHFCGHSQLFPAHLSFSAAMVQAVQAAQTRTNILLTAFFYFIDPVIIGNGSPRHQYIIRLAIGQQLFCPLGITDCTYPLVMI